MSKKNILSFLGILMFLLVFFLNVNVSNLIKSISNNSSAEDAAYNYYVSPQGSDSNSGNLLAPLKTIQKALEKAQPGQSIYLLSGEYYQDVVSVRSGKADSPIKIIGEKDAIVKGAGNGRVFEINHDYLILDGFAIDGLHGSSSEKSGYRDMLIYAVGKQNKDGVTGMKILNMDIKNARGECIRIKYFSHDNEIAYNNITNCGVEDFKFSAGGKNGEGVYIGTAPEQLYKNPTSDLDASNNNYIHHNFFNTQGNEGVDIKEGSEQNIVEYNTITGQKDPESGGLDSRGDKNIFRYNEVYGCLGAGIRLGGDDFGGRDFGKDNQVYGNNLYNNKYGAIKVQVYPQERICENTISNNGSNGGTYGERYDFTEKCEGLVEEEQPNTDDSGSFFNTCYLVCGETIVREMSKMNVSKASSSTYDQRDGGYIAENTLDGNLATRWAGFGLGEWIEYDLGGSKFISYVKIAFHKGDQRVQNFKIEVSSDASSWTKAYEGKSSGGSLGLQKFDFSDRSARFVRIVGGGNTENDWNSLTEAEIYGFGD